MKYTAKINIVNPRNVGYIKTIEFDAQDEQELEELLDMFALGDQSPKIKTDDSLMPKDFYLGCAFSCSGENLSFTDENGKDFSHIIKGAF